MHGSSASAPVVLSGIGGLVTLASPDSVPEGASPRTYDGDYEVGGWKTRPGLKSAYTYDTKITGPGDHAADIPTSSAEWSNPDNVLADTGDYAVVSLAPELTISEIQGVSVTTTVGTPHRTFYYVLVTFTSETPTIVPGLTYTFSGLTSFPALNGQTLTPSPSAGGPINWTDYIVPTSTQALFLFGALTFGPNAETGLAEYTGLSDALDVTQFDLSVPATSVPQGFVIPITAYASVSGASLNIQMLKNEIPAGRIETLALPLVPTVLIFGSSTDLFLSAWDYSDLNNPDFGIRITASSNVACTVSVGYAPLSCYLIPTQCNFEFITPFTDQNGVVKNLSLDANGNFWVEDVTNNPGVLSLAAEGITPNSRAVAVGGAGVEYIAFTNGRRGSDQPIQYTSGWIDRITQVGPGQAPSFTPTLGDSNNYAITSISQPVPFVGAGYCYFLQSQGPGSTSPGTVVTFYYSDYNAGGVPNQDLVNAVNSGNPVYVYASFTGTPTPFGPQTVQVTSVGLASPPNQPRRFYYFTFNVSTSPAYTFYPGSGQPTYSANFQRTLATMDTVLPVPGLQVGNQITISGNSATGYNNVWPISQTPISSTMVITETSVTSGEATYTYALSGGSIAAPAIGQLVTISGTTNANGHLNLVNATIDTATGGSSGSFTLLVPIATDYPTVAEAGYATTAGNEFNFDPGLTTLGTGTTPIYGTGTGGELTFVSAAAQLIGVGTRQGSVFFITRNGYFTCPAPPVTFTCPQNTIAISVTNLPIGPPNVVGRGIILTEPGQDGVPGANFFTIPTPVTYIVENVSYTATSFIINDNTTTNVSLTFTDDLLLESLDVDVYGYNLFNQIEIGDPGWVAQYSTRNAYGLCLNKVQRFLNLSFDGGYLSGSLTPLGWSTPDSYGSLLVSPKFGNSYYINNTTNGTLDVAGLIQQGAYQNYLQNPIIEPNTTYSVRVTAGILSSITIGNLVISLVSDNFTYGTFTLPFASMTSNYVIYEGTLLTAALTTIPTGLTLTVAATDIGAGADVAIDRIDIYPTEIPILTTTVLFSYAGLPEQVDSVTGQVGFSSENQQPVNGGMVLYDTFYGMKGWYGNTPGSSLYSLQASPALEPSDWAEPEVAQRSGGSSGPLSFDLGEQWLLAASRPGIYLFTGGQPGKIMQEIYQVWDAINWTYGDTIWVKVDITHRRFYVGVPLPTPNFWLPNAEVNLNPTSPNVILMCNYQGLDSGEALKESPQMHTTMFGTLNSIDMRRKWSIWQIPAPYGNLVATPDDEQFYVCNGRANSMIYQLDPTSKNDEGVVIDSLYTTAGLVEMSKRAQTAGAGNNRMRWGYMTAAIQSGGNIQCRLLPNKLFFPEPTYEQGYNTWTAPGGITPGIGLNDAEVALNFAATRTFIEFRENDGDGFTLSNLSLLAKKDVWNAMRGRTGV